MDTNPHKPISIFLINSTNQILSDLQGVEINTVSSPLEIQFNIYYPCKIY